MPRNLTCAFVLLLLINGCATAPPVYRFQGLKLAEGAHASDGVFQDFASDTDTLARIWADPDATVHDAKEQAWVRAFVNRVNDSPHLTVEFSRAGYGTSIEIAPKHKVPELLEQNSHLEFEMRSENAACVGIRVMDGDGEVWGYGRPELEYQRLCVAPDRQWKKFSIPIGSSEWFAFKYGGNVDLGNKNFDRKVLALVTFEIGLQGEHYLGQGNAGLDLRDIRVSSRALTVAQAEK